MTGSETLPNVMVGQVSKSQRFIRVENVDGVRVVLLPNLRSVGHPDHQHLGDELLALVEQEDPRPVVLDFENQWFIPHASIEVEFVRLYRRLPNGLAMCNLCRHVKEHFATNRLDQIFRIYEARDEAIAVVRGE